MRKTLHTALLATFVLVGCGRDTAQTQAARPVSAALETFVPSTRGLWLVKLEWLSGPPQVSTKSAGRLTFLDNQQAVAQRVEAASAAILMPSMSHAPRDVQLTHVGSGPSEVWDVADVKPSMSGEWVLRVTATVNGQQDVVDLHFNVL